MFEVEAGRPDVVVMPHRRGDDGYFMVQLTPPGAAGDWERPLVPNGEPLQPAAARRHVGVDGQGAARRPERGAELRCSASLTPKDTINVAACDVNCDWVFEKPVPATPANVAAAQKFLDERMSLGWTDLDKAFASALSDERRRARTSSTSATASARPANADPVAFAKRLQRLYEGKPGTVPRGRGRQQLRIRRR